MRVRSLEEELRQTELLRTELESLRRENARLAQNLSLSTSAPSAVGWARVLERDPANWHRSVMIDAGEAEGVELNAPVLARHVGRMAVIGRIVETLEHSSKVLLLTDDLSAVAAYLPGSGWEGLIQGQGSARLRMNYLPVDEPLHAGDEVATSPTSATFPPDLVIGTVSKVFDRDPFLAFQTVEVAMAVPSGRIKEVLILHKRRRGNP
jgi:rod shape-determining protein MreC